VVEELFDDEAAVFANVRSGPSGEGEGERDGVGFGESFALGEETLECTGAELVARERVQVS
jgi:hypothetical protein